MKGNKLFKKIDRLVGIPLVWTLGLFSRLFSLFHAQPPGQLQPGDRVLVVKLSALGDTLLLLPVFQAIKDKIGPTGRLSVVATALNQDALQAVPFVDEVILFDLARTAKRPWIFLSFRNRLRSLHPRWALDFDQWLRISPLLCFFSGASVRIGFKTLGQYRHYLYHLTVANEKGRHEFEQFAQLAALAGIERVTIPAYNGFLEQLPGFGDSPTAPSPIPVIHLHPGCGASGWQRAWPEDDYVQLIQRLKAKGPVTIQMTGMGAYEEALVRKIIQGSGAEVLDRSGKLELRELSGLLRRADLVICGNTGVMHLAAGLGRPLVALHGPTDPAKWGPLTDPQRDTVRIIAAQLPCSPCLNLGFEYGCPARPCMESLTVDRVYGACLDLLKKTRT